MQASVQRMQTMVARLPANMWTINRLPKTCIHQLISSGRHVHCRAAVWRPSIDDVDRLSRGEGAKRRGTGCFNIPHRLNAEERAAYQAAKKKGYLAVRGSGYRRERKGNPLPNVYRQWCDAKAMATIVVEQDWSGSADDVIVVDLSSLRLTEREFQQAEELCHQLAADMGVPPLAALPNDTPYTVPFQIIPAPEYIVNAASLNNNDSGTKSAHNNKPNGSKAQSGQTKRGVGDDANGKQAETDAPSELTSGLLAFSGQDQRIAAAEAAVQYLQQQADAAADEVRRLKQEEGWPNSSDVVKEAVAAMKKLREHLAEAKTAAELARLPRNSRAAALFSEFGNMQATAAAVSIPANQNSKEDNPGCAAESQETSRQQQADSFAASLDPATSHDNSQITADTGDNFLRCRVSEDSDEHPRFYHAIWGLPARPLYYKAARAEAKAFAKALSTQLCVPALAGVFIRPNVEVPA